MKEKMTGLRFHGTWHRPHRLKPQQKESSRARVLVVIGETVLTGTYFHDTDKIMLDNGEEAQLSEVGWWAFPPKTPELQFGGV